MNTGFQVLTVLLLGDIKFLPITVGVVIGLLIMILLLVCSALVSGSEVAFFSLSPSDNEHLREGKNKKSKVLINMLNKPQRLLATILISNNFVNVSIIILSTYVSNSLVDFSNAKLLGFVFQAVVVTFLLLLFGEIIPKVYATQFGLKFAKFMVFPMFVLEKFFSPLSSVLIYSTSIIKRYFERKKKKFSIDVLSDAIDLTVDKHDDKRILEGIVKFGNIDAKEIMKSRIDVVAIEINSPLSELISIIRSVGYSRFPVYSETFDNVKGILHSKDLLPYIYEKDDFKWQKLIQAPYFVPETKKINHLLEEFQKRKIHLAIVIDEYGGTFGIVTLEDILEEIVGELNDEFDETENLYKKIDKNIYVFEGKTLLNDFYKIIDIEDDVFDDIKGDADSLAGLILEIRAEIPQKGEKFTYSNFLFYIEEADKRRIKKIRITINEK